MAKRLLLVNPVCGILSTGRICTDIAQEYESLGWEVKIAYGRRDDVPEMYRKYGIRIGNMLGVYIHVLISMIFGYHSTGWCSRLATIKFVSWAEKWHPDVVWLHNLHDNYINVEVLFAWLKRHNEYEVRWTHHDLWAMTGCCCYTGMCEQWRSQCRHCPKGNRTYRRGIFGGSEAREYATKKALFWGVKRMKMFSPSEWLAGLIRNSFLKGYPVEVVHNRIDKSIFKPTVSDFRMRYHLGDKRIILGVSGFWDAPTKGLSDFITLSKMVDSDVVIVIVGLTEKLMHDLPENVIGIKRTNSAQELAAIYSAATVFYNPTRLDNYPTVNLEAAACECPVITYDSGGAAETVADYAKAIVLRGSDKTPEGFLRAFEVVCSGRYKR